MYNRKEKEKILQEEHSNFLDSLIDNYLFAAKTAFFTKGKYGRNIQLFENELNKGLDIYIEVVDIIRDNSGLELDMVSMYEERPLFKYKYNPYYSEEYELKISTNSKGGEYSAYIVPMSELVCVNKGSKEIPYNIYEKEREQKPKEQIKLSLFPDFEQEFGAKKESDFDLIKENDLSFTDITVKDFAAIMWKKPVSDKKWLNDLINNI